MPANSIRILRARAARPSSASAFVRRRTALFPAPPEQRRDGAALVGEGRRTAPGRATGSRRRARGRGSGCTSTIRPSAPAATAARASGSTLSRLPVPWLGSTMMGRWLSRWTTGINAQVQRVAGVVREGADAALAEDHVVIALRQDVLGGHQELVDRGGHAALEQHRLARRARRVAAARSSACCARRSGCSRRTRSTRSKVSVSMASVTMPRPVSSRASASSFSPSSPEPLEGVGRSARLVGAAAQHGGSGRLHGARGARGSARGSPPSTGPR